VVAVPDPKPENPLDIAGVVVVVEPKNDFCCVPPPNKLVLAGVVVVVEIAEPNNGLAAVEAAPDPNNPPDVVAVLVDPKPLVVPPVENNPVEPKPDVAAGVAGNFLLA
jgi:hypothetical protein